MGRFKMKSLGRRARKDREKCQEELTKGETTEDSWKTDVATPKDRG